jgi:hypothetical protein
MTSTTENAVHPVVAGLRAVADALAGLPLWQSSGVEQANLLVEVETECRRIAFGSLRLVADIDARNIAVEQGRCLDGGVSAATVAAVPVGGEIPGVRGSGTDRIGVPVG